MDNEVVIHVRSDDDTDRGFASARGKAKRFGADIDDEVRKIGPKIGEGLGGGMLGGLKGTLPSFAQFGAAVGVIMAPTLGAAVAAGVMGGAGGLGIAGGLALAAKDPRVAAAGENLKAELGADLKEAASSFVPVAITSLGKLRGAFKELLPDIRAIFQTSSTFVDPLLDGMISGGKRIIGSIRNLVEGAQPVFESFGRAFDEIGDTVGDVFDSLADNGEEGASAVDDLVGAVTNFVEVTGKAINGLAELKGQFDSLDEGIDKQRYKLEDSVSWLDLTADGYEKGSEAAELYRQGLIGVAGSANDYNNYLQEQKKASDAATASTKKQTSALAELADEMLAQTDPLFGVIDATRDVREAQEKYNKALKDSGPRSDAAKDALAELGEAAFKLTDKVGDAAGGFNGKLTPAMRTALRNAGLSAGQINKLEKELLEAARAARNWEGTFTQTYVTRRIIKGPGGQNLSAGGGGRQAPMAHGGIKGAASGMVGDGLTWVGENGPELLDLPPGAQVHSNPDSRRIMAQGAAQGAGGGAASVRVFFDSAGLAGLAAALMETLRAEIRGEGGNVQNVLGVPGAA